MEEGGTQQESKIVWLLAEIDFKSKITDKQKLKYALQCSGRNPSDSSLEKYWTKYGGSVSFSQFCSIMRREKLPTMSDLLSLFQKLDTKGHGFLSLTDLRTLLTKKGESMLPEEFDSIFSELDIKEDQFDYTEFCYFIIETTQDTLNAAKLKTQFNNEHKIVQGLLNPTNSDTIGDQSSIEGLSTDLSEVTPLEVTTDSELEVPDVQEHNENAKKENGKQEILIDEKNESSNRCNEMAKTTTTIQQTNHLNHSTIRHVTNSIDYVTTNTSSPPECPSNIEGKGCFYFKKCEDEGKYIVDSHQYILILPHTTEVWIQMKVTQPGNPDIDIGLYVFCMSEDETPDQLITYTKHCITGNVWVCRVLLEKGQYILLPFTSGCILGKQENNEQDMNVLVVHNNEGKINFTQQCIDLLTEVFQRHDLDSNNSISFDEFDFFNERCGKDPCDSMYWKTITDNYETTEDLELTLNGFIEVIKGTTEGETELFSIIENMGYNRNLKLDKACPFYFEVFTESCDGEIQILPLSQSAQYVDKSLCVLAKCSGMVGSIRGATDDKIIAHSLVNPHMTSIMIENKDSVKHLVQVDCSHSTNSLFNCKSAITAIEVEPHSITVAYHVVPQLRSQPYKVIFIASIIKT